MRRASTLVIAVLGLVLSLSRNARAERVLLVEPDPSDAVLFDARNRLAAELRIHHFDVESIEAPEGRAPETVLVAEAEKRHALAGMALAHRGPEPAVDVWLLDHATGKVTRRTLDVERAADAASVLAIRAVDLVRASLHEPAVDEAAPKAAASKDLAPKDAAISARGAVAEAPEPRVRLRAEALLFVESGAGTAIGPSFSGLYLLTPPLE